tara:strand:+ start:941 stop:1273 length:333 start_codon:yes stop_codon:yes gene_type:complete
MKIFICVNDLQGIEKESYDPAKIINKVALNQEVLGIFFYSHSVNDLAEKTKSSIWLSFAKEKNIPIYACTNSLTSRNLLKKISPTVEITGLGQLIEGVLYSKKTIVIGSI